MADNPLSDLKQCFSTGGKECKSAADCNGTMVCCLGEYLDIYGHGKTQTCCDLESSSACTREIEPPKEVNKTIIYIVSAVVASICICAVFLYCVCKIIRYRED